MFGKPAACFYRFLVEDVFIRHSAERRPLQVSFYPFSLTCQRQNENLTIFWGDYDNFMRKRHDVRASVGICCSGFNKRSKYSHSCILTGVSSGRGRSYESSGRVETGICARCCRFGQLAFKFRSSPFFTPPSGGAICGRACQFYSLHPAGFYACPMLCFGS